MVDPTQITLTNYINISSAIAVLTIGIGIGIVSIVNFITKKKKLLPIVAIMGVSYGSFNSGPVYSFIYYMVNGTHPTIPVIFLSVTLVPIAVTSSMYLGFNLFRPSKKNLVALIYGLTSIPFWILLYSGGFNTCAPYGVMMDCSLKSFLLYITIFYIASVVLIIVPNIYKLAKKTNDAKIRGKLMKLVYGFLFFAIGITADAAAPPTNLIMIFRILMATGLILLYMGFSPESRKNE